MSSAVIELMFSVGPRIVRASGVPTYATSCSRSKTTSSIWLSTSSISRRITSRSRSTDLSGASQHKMNSLEELSQV